MEFCENTSRDFHENPSMRDFEENPCEKDLENFSKKDVEHFHNNTEEFCENPQKGVHKKT